MSNNEELGIGIAIIFGLAIAIIVSRQLFPVFLGLSILSLIILVVVLIMEVSSGSFGEISMWVAGGFAVFLLLSGVTWFVGYGIGGKSFGEASVEIYTEFTGAQEQLSQEVQEAIDQVIEDSCETLPEESCQTLKQTAQAARTLEEVQSKAKQLRRAQELAEGVNK